MKVYSKLYAANICIYYSRNKYLIGSWLNAGLKLSFIHFGFLKNYNFNPFGSRKNPDKDCEYDFISMHRGVKIESSKSKTRFILDG